MKVHEVDDLYSLTEILDLLRPCNPSESRLELAGGLLRLMTSASCWRGALGRLIMTNEGA